MGKILCVGCILENILYSLFWVTNPSLEPAVHLRKKMVKICVKLTKDLRDEV